MDRIKLTKQFVDAASAPEGKDYLFFWDQAVRGFGIKFTASGTRTYVVQYRTPGGRSGVARRYTIGKHGSPWTVDTARNEAKRVLGLVAKGEDPALLKRKFGGSPTVAELCEDYMKHGVGTKKTSTLATDRGRIDRHIVPLLGKKKVNQIAQADIRRFMSSVAKGETAASVKTKKHGRAIVRGGKGTASRTLGLLGGIFSYAVQEGYIEENPTRGVERFPDRKSERFLTLDELKTVGAALADMRIGREDNPAFDIIALLVLTGARKGEIEGLNWSEVDFDTRCLRLADSKTGQKIIPLNKAAVETLEKLEPKRRRNSDWVFPATKGGNTSSGRKEYGTCCATASACRTCGSTISVTLSPASVFCKASRSCSLARFSATPTPARPSVTPISQMIPFGRRPKTSGKRSATHLGSGRKRRGTELPRSQTDHIKNVWTSAMRPQGDYRLLLSL